MARYYFDLHECGERTIDEDGIEAKNLGAAHDLAVTAVRDIMCGEIRGGALCLSCHIEILDADRQVLEKVRFRDAVRISGL